MNKFEKWLLSNKICDKDRYLWLDKDNKISIDDMINLLDKLSILLNEKELINFNILDNNNYKDIKRVIDLFIDNKKIINSKKDYDLYLELLNYYLKYIYTTYEKKYDIEEYIKSFNNNIDISNINMFSKFIFEELCKWPYMYVILENKKYITKSVKKDNYSMLCIPIYSNKIIIPDEYKNDKYNIKRIKINLLLNKLDNDENNHAVYVVLNPKYDGKDKVFIDLEESFWYYFADLSNYF